MEKIFDQYRRNVIETESELERLRHAININALLRLGAIVGGGTAMFVAAQSEHLGWVASAFFTIVLLFSGLVWRQSKLERRKTEATCLWAINRNELDIAEGKANRYPDGSAFVQAKHPYSGDLDVFGLSSLYALINRAATPQANTLLADWLSAPANATVITQRQEVVRELADDLSWCQEFQARLWFNLGHPVDFKAQFSQFLSNSERSFGSNVFRLYVRASPWLMFMFIGASFFLPYFSGISILFAVGHFMAAMGYGRRINQLSGLTDKAGRLLSAFAAAFELIEKREWKSQRGRELFLFLRSSRGDTPVSEIFRKLSRVIERLDYRLNVLVGIVLNMVALWDFRQAYALIEWRKTYGDDVLHAFDAVAELEATIGLATLRRNHPHWVFPSIEESERPLFSGEAIAHPLIAADRSVANNYHMGQHRIALVTGSNMAGKSTFLRTVGANAVLAFCGAPVCAAAMHLSVFQLVTYMRITDSLAESTSTFKAELNRIQHVLRTVEEHSNAFFLIDEMLRGTNSVDKYRGSKAIIKKLIDLHGVGMVATHDLQLATLADEYPGLVSNYHFDIQVRNGEMFFDYKLKSGPCTVFNASQLLKGIGVDVDG